MPVVPNPPALDPIMGHRGARGHAPENTLAGMARAHALGTRWVEFDVKLTADGALILLHDDTVNRTTDGKGPAAGKTLSEFRALDAGRWFSPDFAGERVPTLDEAMEFLARHDMGANVEIKPCPGREAETGAAVARELVRWMSGPRPPFVSSFSEISLAAARAAAPAIPRGFLTEDFPADWAARCAALGCATFHPHHKPITREKARSVREAGFRLLTYTVNEPARCKALLSWGVESVITDYPDRMPGA